MASTSASTRMAGRRASSSTSRSSISTGLHRRVGHERLFCLPSIRYTEHVPQDQLVVRGAREHNLKNVDVAFPRDRLVVITGLSGSGQSSHDFDTVYAEGQR